MDDNGFESINIIPLVDVMLVLLTIVLTTSTFIAVGAIPVQLPKAESSTTAPLQTATVEIDKQGLLYLNAQVASTLNLQIFLLERTLNGTWKFS